ncbi:MAG: hypothetical protein IPH08_04565 [Rhodocyclaceae bacterium]|nr:hypothetical protein [Rhodocyclaceae bacterium]
MSAIDRAQVMAIAVGALLGWVLFRELAKHGYSLTDTATRGTAWVIIGVFGAGWFVVVWVTLSKLPR